MIAIGSALWLLYAYDRRDYPVMLANGVTGLLSLVSLIMKRSVNEAIVSES